MNKNRTFAASLAEAIDPAESVVIDNPSRGGRLGIGTLAGRTNRLAELASGSLVSSAQELVDPSRCRMWADHNRDYGLLDEERCADLIESLKAQRRQEVPAIVRRLRDDPEHDFEIVCGARRHWAVSWLRKHNYPDFRFLVEVRELTDEEAFRLSDLENRAREDLTDIERARDYLKALDRHYGGKQKAMAERLSVTEGWLSRYLDLARLPQEILVAFPRPQDLHIKHITQLKPLLKPDDRRERVFAAAARKEPGSSAAGGQENVAAIIRRLTLAAEAPKRSGHSKSATKRSGETVMTHGGLPLMRVVRRGQKEVSLTLLPHGGGSREDARIAILRLLDECWT